METRLESAIRKVIRFLDDHQYRYALIGGIALAQWGVVRATYDVDIKVVAPHLDYAAVRQAIRSTFPEPARQELPRNPFIVAISVNDIIVDLLLALPGYEELIIERAVLRDLGGWQAWICTAEDLIIQKVVAGRDKDWLDVEALLIEQRHRLDEAYTEGWLHQFADALENPDLLPRYRRLLAKAKAFG
jgi:predicted nucleotidyltransferase